MGDAFIINLGRESVYLLLMLSTPFLLSSLILGIIISIIQAVTQIQDNAITFVPKFFLLGIILLATGGWMMSMMQDFAIRIITSVASFTH